ncbi:MAG: UDP-4-amino-4,6-dideoxy-N-acetyl-beta-L-altrosamine transaminase [Candidatus Omnitrophica bacterium]|nr:UDP-4-amino-4,6-dideoxy-N-acetyl-beta-L-altrosamine transaminase [Candidatus Omnitrophota bacterium]
MLPYGRHTVVEADIQAVVEVLRSERLTQGPVVDAFEAAVAEAVGARYAVAFSSGTAALHAAVFAAGLGPGDEAITTPLTFCATANSVLYQGAQPVFADVCPDTLNLDPSEAARRVTPRTKAILPVDYAGHPADLDAFLAVADRHGLVIIEDACHALGATFKGKRVGGLSHMTVFSFHPVKHITTGEGGMVTTDHQGFARRLRVFRQHGIEEDERHRDPHRPWYYEMTELGYNYRLSDIGCALGLSQLTRLQANLERRAAIAQRYHEAFGSLPGLRCPAQRSGVRHAWHLYPIRLESPTHGMDRAKVIHELRARGLGVSVHFIPVYWHPYYRQRLGMRPGLCPVAEDAYHQLISLPMFHGMGQDEVERVIVAVADVFRALA